MDDGSPAGYLSVIILLLMLSAYFSATETAFASINRIRMMSYADDGNRKAARVVYILDHFDKALTSLLIGNNIVNTACASVATLMATKLWGQGSVTAATLLTTLVVFFFAEMLPKTYAKECNERFAMSVSGSLLFLMRIFTPVSFVFSRLSNAAKRMVSSDEQEEPTVTEDELHDIIETIGDAGELDDDTTELVQSALEFTGTTVADVVTPWDQVTTLKSTMSAQEVMEVINAAHYSRLPVIDSSGEVCGILQIRRFLKEYLQKGSGIRLTRLMDRVYRIQSGMPIDEVLDHLSAKKVHMAVVAAPDGHTLGIVTVEDILEELVGEIYDEEDKEAHADE